MQVKSRFANPSGMSSTGNDDSFGVGQRDQAVVRLVIVVTVMCFLLIKTALKSQPFFPPPDYLVIIVTYFFISCGLLFWSQKSLNAGNASGHSKLKRILFPVADIGITTAMMLTMEEYAGLLYPVLLSITLGNGMRAGVFALLLSQALSIIGLGLLVLSVPYWREHPSLTTGYLIGLLLIPLYILSLIRRLSRTLDDLKHTNEARSRFIANMSHELRTPLHAIISTADVLREQASQDRERADLLRMITSSADHLLMMVNQVLDVAKLESGAISTHQAPFPLMECIRKVSDMTEAQASTKGLAFNQTFDADLPDYLMGDAERLSQILINLLGNAVKFTHRGQVGLSVSRTVDKDGEWLRLDIEDSGIGMSASALQTIYQPFTQAEADISRRYGGTGLGLTIVNDLVRLAGGHIDCRSVQNVGTHFTVMLPLEAAPPVAAPAPQGAATPLWFVAPQLPEALRAAMLDAGFNPTCMEPERLHSALAAGASEPPALLVIDATTWRTHTLELIRAAQAQTRVPLGVYMDQRGALFGPDAGPAPCRYRISPDMDRPWHRLHALLCDAATQDLAQTQDVAPNLRCLKVLVADDNFANRRTAEMALSSAGHEITVVGDGEAALDALENGTFDIALMDMHMPGMDGLEAARLYRHIAPPDATPIVMLTADVTEEARKSAERAGVAAFVLKPAGAQVLRETVLRHARASAAPTVAASTAQDRDAGQAISSAGGGAAVVSLSEAIIDPTELRELIACGSDPSELEALVHEFITDVFAQIDEARHLYGECRWGEAREIMHSIKGSASVIGAVGLKTRVQRLETLPIAELTAHYATQLRELGPILERTQAALLGELERSIADNGPRAETRPV